MKYIVILVLIIVLLFLFNIKEKFNNNIKYPGENIGTITQDTNTDDIIQSILSNTNYRNDIKKYIFESKIRRYGI